MRRCGWAAGFFAIAMAPVLGAGPEPGAAVDPAIRFGPAGAATEVVVCLVDDAGRAPAGNAIMDELIGLVGPANVIDRFGHDAILARLTAAEAARIARHPRVAALGSNEPVFHTQLPDSILIHRAVETWAVETAGGPLTGAGRTVAVLDTGIDFTHDDLAAKNIVGCNVNCVVPSGACVPNCAITDCFGHGTRVGGIAGADGVVQGIGVGVDLASLKIFTGCSGTGATATDIRRAIDWAVDNAAGYNIVAISMSIGDGICHATACDNDASLTLIRVGVENAVAAGIAVTAAAGNNGCLNGINGPACLSDVIAVGASTKLLSVWVNSNRGPLVQLFATGRQVLSTIPGNAHDPGNGTSMATPMVAGAIAIIRQFLDGIGAALTPLEMEQLLFDTGFPLTNLPPELNRIIDIAPAIQALIDDLVTPGDIDLNGSVGISDLLILLGAWGPCPACGELACLADLNGDCNVGIADLLVLLGNWS